jgi:hypothetical protein
VNLEKIPILNEQRFEKYSQWWLRDIKELINSLEEFTQSFCPPATDDKKYMS